MKKIYMTLSTTATLILAIALNSCNNAEEVKKQTEEQNTKIQTMVDEKLNGLLEEVNKECSAKVDSLSGIQFTAWQAEEAKAHKGKKAVSKTKAKPVTKKEEPKVDKGSTTYRPGASKEGEVKTTTDRPGASKQNEIKPTTDRPGASKP